MSRHFINLDIISEERYDMAKFMELIEDGGYDPLTSAFFGDLRDLTVFGIYEIQAEEGRPDLLSSNIYTDMQYWWILLIYNDIFDYRSLVPGLQIKYPSLEDVEDLFFSLKSRQTAVV